MQPSNFINSEMQNQNPKIATKINFLKENSKEIGNKIRKLEQIGYKNTKFNDSFDYENPKIDKSQSKINEAKIDNPKKMRKFTQKTTTQIYKEDSNHNKNNNNESSNPDKQKNDESEKNLKEMAEDLIKIYQNNELKEARKENLETIKQNEALKIEYEEISKQSLNLQNQIDELFLKEKNLQNEILVKSAQIDRILSKNAKFCEDFGKILDKISNLNSDSVDCDELFNQIKILRFNSKNGEKTENFILKLENFAIKIFQNLRNVEQKENSNKQKFPKNGEDSKGKWLENIQKIAFDGRKDYEKIILFSKEMVETAKRMLETLKLSSENQVVEDLRSLLIGLVEKIKEVTESLVVVNEKR
ncbi:hypothetical protein MHBO_002292 [Bonamia ostreae]|uniref:Viral A-type inclusion protein n=1 Tax=Bonamia ostreae TaxID=126728 RepID=A0ABV2AMG3_9EUKA